MFGLMSKFLLSLQKFGGLANLDPHSFLAKKSDENNMWVLYLDRSFAL